MDANNATTPDFPTSTPDVPLEETQGSPVVAFLIGLSIILISSILNAGGLNLTKLDHIRTSALPKSARRSDFLRPLWVIGMLLYILSQLIGSTLALEYMRAEYVAPLGSTSLIFNFLFASLIGSPVSKWDIYGTVVVVFGVIGIVAFGSVNSGLHTNMDLQRVEEIWGRAGWLGYFILMTIGIIIVFIGTSQLDSILVARADLQALPTSNPPSTPKAPTSILQGLKDRWTNSMHWTRGRLDDWTAARDDKYLAWMLGIGWSCVGGGLAGACLVFAKAVVKLTSLYMANRAPATQFLHPAVIVTIVLLATTAVTQIVCLNRGLKVYDSTLVVPMFYGVYTASGFLNSLVFNDEVDAYKPWTLGCLGISIMVLISGVVLLTHKKPEPKPVGAPNRQMQEDALSLHSIVSPVKSRKKVDDDAAQWEIGNDSESETEEGGPSTPKKTQPRRPSAASSIHVAPVIQKHAGEEGKGLMNDEEDEEHDGSPTTPTRGRQEGPGATLSTAVPPPRKLVSRSPSLRSDDFGEWEDGAAKTSPP